MSTNVQIKQASEAIQDDFFDYYQNLVNYFHHNSEQNLNYATFANRTNRAKNALACEREAIFYMVAYGWQHHQSMQHLLSETINVVNKDFQSPIRVVDYGCGQGVATLAVIDYLAQKGMVNKGKLEVHLIEPSAVSLSIAMLLIERLALVLGFEVEIHSQNCNISSAKLTFDSELENTIHLMSNILDIAEVQDSLECLVSQIKNNKGNNFLLATCPSYSNTNTGFEKLREVCTFACVFHDENWNMNYHLYRVVQGNWQNHNSNQRMMALEWKK